MSVQRIRFDYAGLNDIAAQFKTEADRTQQTINTLEEMLALLQGGDWLGSGASTFYEEMEQSVLPALARLQTAFQSAGEETLHIKQVGQQAEEEAAQVFKCQDSQPRFAIQQSSSAQRCPCDKDASTCQSQCQHCHKGFNSLVRGKCTCVHPSPNPRACSGGGSTGGGGGTGIGKARPPITAIK